MVMGMGAMGATNELLKVITTSGKVRLAIDFDQNADFSTGVHVGSNLPLARDPRGFLGRGGDSLGP